jgi:hypothetical protein
VNASAARESGGGRRDRSRTGTPGLWPRLVGPAVLDPLDDLLLVCHDDVKSLAR